MLKSFVKITVLTLIVGLNLTGLSAIVETFAYFNDIEESVGNSYSAGTLDFSVTNNNIEELIGVELGEDIEFTSVLTKMVSSLDIQYRARAEKISGNDDFCNSLELEAFHNAILYDGSLLSFDTATTIVLGTWAFEIKLPHTATYIAHGEECNIDLVFEGWRQDVADSSQSGFTDEERIQLRLTSRMVVLNEFLPRPNGVAYGFDFGNDSSNMPQGEWVEFYNNSDYEMDISGWYVWDASGSETNKIFITDENTYPAGTVIGGKGWLVVYMNKAVLNNTGDTVKLFDNNGRLVDSYTYTTTSDYCDIEPTPGDENATDTSGSCAGVPPNKSYARIPDGIGAWVDPIPTPGGPNRLELIEEVSFDEIIDEIISEEITEEVIVELPDIDIIETTTPSTEEVIVMQEEPEPQVVEEEESIEEPVIEEESEPEPEPEPIIEEQPVNEEESAIEEEPGIEEEPVVAPDDSSNGDSDGEAPSESGDSYE